MARLSIHTSFCIHLLVFYSNIYLTFKRIDKFKLQFLQFCLNFLFQKFFSLKFYDSVVNKIFRKIFARFFFFRNSQGRWFLFLRLVLVGGCLEVAVSIFLNVGFGKYFHLQGVEEEDFSNCSNYSSVHWKMSQNQLK